MAAVLLAAVLVAVCLPQTSAYLMLPWPMGPYCTDVSVAQPGDTCSSVASNAGLTTAYIIQLNWANGVNCFSKLTPGTLICTSATYTVACGQNVATAGWLDTCASVGQKTAFQWLNGILQYFWGLPLITRLNKAACAQQFLIPGQLLCLPTNPGFVTNPQPPQSSSSSSGSGSSSSSWNGGWGSRRLQAAQEEGAGAVQTELSLEVPGRHLQGSGSSSSSSYSQSQCIGNTYAVQSSDSPRSCASLATIVGLSQDTMLYLNPTLNNTSCQVPSGFKVCIGCTGNLCGVQISQGLQAFLNFPTTNQQLCAILAQCQFQKSPFYQNAGSSSESLTFTLNQQTQATSQSGGFSAIDAFFSNPGGTYYNTGPNPALEIIINPYFGAADGNGNYQGLVQFNALTQSTSRRLLLAADGGEDQSLTQDGDLILSGPGRGLLGTVTTRQSQNPQSKVSSSYN